MNSWLHAGGRLRIGVLALQGGFAEHIAQLHKLGVETSEIRLASQLSMLDGLIIPGGESTTMLRLMKEYDLIEPVKKLELAVMGTCAGMVVIARKASGINGLGLIDIDVRRNAFGRQADSFETELEIKDIGAFHCVFIRAPLIERAGNSVEVLARLPDGTAVAAREGRVLATAFHPELTDDLRLHSLFLSLVRDDK
jgi:5'-phosphate synthase pdxT subunit